LNKDVEDKKSFISRLTKKCTELEGRLDREERRPTGGAVGSEDMQLKRLDELILGEGEARTEGGAAVSLGEEDTAGGGGEQNRWVGGYH